MTGCIDTHCHLSDPAFDSDREAAIARMAAAGVERAIVVESALERLDATAAWVAGQPTLSWATGCHPHDASHWDEGARESVLRAWQTGGVVAAGEMGLDYHYDHSPRDIQRRVFADQLAAAVAEQLPIIIHAREADADVAAILREQPTARVVLHSFSSGPLLREAGLALGCWFSFSGMITFRSWQDEAAVREVPPERLLVETDAPYLAPVPHRGRRNEPAFVANVLQRLAEMRGVPVAEMAALTRRNAQQFFGLDSPC